MTALGSFDQCPDGAHARQWHLADALTVGEAVGTHRADGILSPRREQNRLGEFRSIQNREAVENCRVILRDQIAPMVGLKVIGISDTQSPAGSITVGEDVQPTIPTELNTCLRIHPNLHGC